MSDSPPLRRLPLLLPLTALLLLLPGCALVRTIAGGNIDPERFEQARTAVMMDVRTRGAAALAQRLAQPPAPGEADLVLTLSEAAVNKAARQLVGTRGWLDATMPYVIDSVDARIYNGSAVMTLGLTVTSLPHNVTVQLAMDCAMSLAMRQGALECMLEPFNISPVVTAGGLLSSVEDVIRDVIKVKLARMSTDFPPLRFPVDFANRMTVEGTRTPLRGRINIDVSSPRRTVNYGMTLREVLMFERTVLVSLDLSKVEVK